MVRSWCLRNDPDARGARGSDGLELEFEGDQDLDSKAFSPLSQHITNFGGPGLAILAEERSSIKTITW